MNKKFTPFIAVVILIGVGFFILTKQNPKPFTPIVESTPPASPSATTEKKPTVDTSNWTIYINKTFGYTLKFPVTYQVPLQSEKQKSQIGVDNNMVVQKKSDSTGNSLIVIDVNLDKDNLSLKDYMNNSLKIYSITGPLISYDFNGYDSLFNKNQPGTNVFVKNGINIYHISAPSASSDKEVGDIVATFKFTQ